MDKLNLKYPKYIFFLFINEGATNLSPLKSREESGCTPLEEGTEGILQWKARRYVEDIDHFDYRVTSYTWPCVPGNM